MVLLPWLECLTDGEVDEQTIGSAGQKPIGLYASMNDKSTKTRVDILYSMVRRGFEYSQKHED